MLRLGQRTGVDFHVKQISLNVATVAQFYQANGKAKRHVSAGHWPLATGQSVLVPRTSGLGNFPARVRVQLVKSVHQVAEGATGVAAVADDAVRH